MDLPKVHEALSERPLDNERAEVRDLLLEMYAAWTPVSGKKTWAAFARHAGVSEYSLTEWRSGRGSPSAGNLVKLLRAGARLGPATSPLSAEDRTQIEAMSETEMLREALQNQRQQRDHLEALSMGVAGLAEDLETVLKILEAQYGTTQQPEALQQ